MSTRFNLARAAIAALGALALSACGINSVPTAEEEAKAKWADVQAAFQERANLIPNLQEIVLSSAEQERETLEGVIQARASATQVQLSADDLQDPGRMAAFQQAVQPLFDLVGPTTLVQREVAESPRATHLTYEIVRDQADA